MTLPAWYSTAALAFAFGVPALWLLFDRPRHLAAWAPLSAVGVVLAPEGLFEVPDLLLGSSFIVDTLSRWLLLLSLALFVALGALNLAALQRSRLACSALVVAWLGALCQCLAADLVIFLAGGALLGYGLLALALAMPGALPAARASAMAVLLVAGDLALLELVMLLVKYAQAADYRAAGAALAALRGTPLAVLCVAVGFGSRLALVLPALPSAAAPLAAVRLLSGWIVPGLCAGAALLRLNCADGADPACASRTAGVLWWVLPVALLAWLLPRALPRCIRLIEALGATLAAWRDRCRAGFSGGMSRAAAALPVAIGIERRLAGWRVAMGLAVLLAAVLALAAVGGGGLP